MEAADFDLKALYDALDERRRSRELSWEAATREISPFNPAGHPIASSTIARLKSKAVSEGDGILQMLLWLRRTPESFVPGFEDAGAERFHLRRLGRGQILRWDTAALHAALNEQRQARRMSWKEVANEVGGVGTGMLTHLAKGGRTSFPAVMRIVRWLGKPAATFTRASHE